MVGLWGPTLLCTHRAGAEADRHPAVGKWIPWQTPVARKCLLLLEIIIEIRNPWKAASGWLEASWQILSLNRWGWRCAEATAWEDGQGVVGPLSRKPPCLILVPRLTLFPELQGGGPLPFLEADAYTAQSPGTRPCPFWGPHGGKRSPAALVRPRAQMCLLPKECAGPIFAVSFDVSSVSIVMRGVDLDCQKHLFPLCFLKAAWVLVLCLGPPNFAMLPGKWLTSALPSPWRVWRAQLWTSWNSRKNPFFSLFIFASTRAASFWIYEYWRFFFLL